MLSQLGGRSFAAAARKLWNSFPAELRHTQSLSLFTTKLKLISFKLAFGDS